MRVLDVVKALGLAIGLLAANFAILFAAVFIYAATIARGHTPDFYAAAAPHIAMWTAPLGGAALFFVSGVKSRLPFLLTTWGMYTLLDIATGGFHLDVRLLLSLGGALVAGVIGTRVRTLRAGTAAYSTST